MLNFYRPCGGCIANQGPLITFVVSCDQLLCKKKNISNITIIEQMFCRVLFIITEGIFAFFPFGRLFIQHEFAGR